MKKGTVGAVIATLACIALVVGSFAIYSEAQAAPCRCPLLYAPVKCDNGKTYSNQCFADCHHAKNCVPIGGPLP
jgi:hypothetical protein